MKALAMPAVCAALVVSLAGCASSAARGATPREPQRARTSDVQRYVWLQASCSDGEMDLASLGFERSVELRARGPELELTFDTALATDGCWSTSVWSARALTFHRDGAGEAATTYRFEPQAWVTLPPEAPCGMEERKPALGELEVAGDELVIVTRQSPWCRGLDARFVYRAVPSATRLPSADNPNALAARYLAQLARGDAEALASMFAEEGSLVEPFTRTADHQPARHQGRAAIQRYFEQAFASVSWHALRVLSLTPRAESSSVVADFEYMDAALATPLRARTLLVLAGGELFESEIQLVTDPVPVTESPHPPAPLAPSPAP